MATKANHPTPPLPNDKIEPQAEAPPRNPGRNSNGTFSRGNRGGPGNPFARRVAELRCAFIGAVLPEDLQQIARRLITMAAMGDLAAAKLVVGYVLGKVPGPVDPDTLDQQECRMYQQNISCTDIGEVVQHRPPADMAAGILRCNEIANVERGHQFAQQIREEDAKLAELQKEQRAVAAGPENLAADDEFPDAAAAQHEAMLAERKPSKRRPAAARRQRTVPAAHAGPTETAVVPGPLAPNRSEASGVASAPRVPTGAPPSPNRENRDNRAPVAAPAPTPIGGIGAPDGRAS